MEVDEPEEQGATAAASSASKGGRSTSSGFLHSGLSPSVSSILSLSPPPPPSLRDPVAFPAGSLATFASSEESMLAAAKRALASAAPRRSALKNRCTEPEACRSRGWCSCKMKNNLSNASAASAPVLKAAATSASSSSSAAAVPSCASSSTAASCAKRIRFAARPEELLRAAVFSPRITSPSPFNPSKAERGKKKREWRRAQQENREEPDEALETAAAADKPALLEWYRELDRRVEEALRNSEYQTELTESSADHRAALVEAAKRPRAEDSNDDDGEEDDDEEDDEDDVIITQPKADTGSNIARVNADLFAISRTLHHASSPPSAAPRSPITQPKRSDAQPQRNATEKTPAVPSAPLQSQPQRLPQQHRPLHPNAFASLHTHSLSGLMVPPQRPKQKPQAEEKEQTRTISQLKSEFCVTRAPVAAATTQPKPQQQPPPPPSPLQRPPLPPPREQFSGLRDVDEIDRNRKRKQPSSALLPALGEKSPFIASGPLTSSFNSSSSLRIKKSKMSSVIKPLQLTNAPTARQKPAREGKAAEPVAAPVRSHAPRRTVTQGLSSSLSGGLPPAAPSAAASSSASAFANRSEVLSAYPPLNRNTAVLNPRAPVSPQINLISPDAGGRSMEVEATPMQPAPAAARNSVVAPPLRVVSSFAAPKPFLPTIGSSFGDAITARALPEDPIAPQVVASLNSAPSVPSSPPVVYRPYVYREVSTGHYRCDRCATVFDPRSWFNHMVAHFKSKHPDLYEIIAPLDARNMKKQWSEAAGAGVQAAPAGAAAGSGSAAPPPPPTAPSAKHSLAFTSMAAPLAPVATARPSPTASAPQHAAVATNGRGGAKSATPLPACSKTPPLLPRMPQPEMSMTTAPAAVTAAAPLPRAPPPSRRAPSSPPLAFALPPRAALKSPAAARVPSPRPPLPLALTDWVPEHLRSYVRREHSNYRCLHCDMIFELQVPTRAIQMHAKVHAAPRHDAPLFSLRNHLRRE